MAYKILIGSQSKGGSTAQQTQTVELAAKNLEEQLNDEAIESVEGVFVHDINPLHTEVIAIVKVAGSKKKEK